MLICSFRRFSACAIATAFLASPMVNAGIIFQDNFGSQTVGNQPAWSAVSDNNAATDPTVKFRIVNDGDPFGTGTAGANNYLLIKDTSNSVGGNATVRGLAGASNIATLSFDVVEPDRAGTGSRLYLHVGQTTGTLATDADRAYQVYFTDGFFNSPGGTGTTVPEGTKHSISIVMNFSDAGITYAGVGGANETLASGKFDLYIDGVKKFNDFNRYSAGTPLPLGTALSAFNFQSFGGDANQEVQVDNVVLQTGAVVPEPAAVGLIGLGMGALALRRR